MEDYTGKRFGNYLLVERIGEGGFADVYKGQHMDIQSPSPAIAAIKVLKKQLTGKQIDKFCEEASTLWNLRHPNIVRVRDFEVPKPIGTRPPYLVMEFAPNGSFTQFLGKPQSPLTILPYIKQIADALQYVHEGGRMHLDVKPENILLGSNNEALLSDFGIAIAIQSAVLPSTRKIYGSPAYTAPERLQRKPPCFASDQYSLGVVVYELLSGTCPFEGSTGEIIRQQLDEKYQPPPLHTRVPNISSAIEQVVHRAFAKDPNKRFPTVKAFADELEKAILLEVPLSEQIPKPSDLLDDTKCFQGMHAEM